MTTVNFKGTPVRIDGHFPQQGEQAPSYRVRRMRCVSCVTVPERNEATIVTGCTRRNAFPECRIHVASVAVKIQPPVRSGVVSRT